MTSDNAQSSLLARHKFTSVFHRPSQMPPISREYLQQMTYMPSKKTEFLPPLNPSCAPVYPISYFILFWSCLGYNLHEVGFVIKTKICSTIRRYKLQEKNKKS